MAPVKLAPVTTNAVTVTNMSLQDCIQVGLEHNLDVKIQRYNPELSRFALKSDFGAYDPSFSASGSHDFNQAPGGYDPQGRPYQGTVADNNRGSAGFSGLAPWGLNYSLQGSLSDSYGANQFGPFENVSGTAGFLQLRQPLLKNAWIDSSRLQIILDRRNLKISELQFRSQVINTVTAIEEAYYNLIYQQEYVKVQERALELANRLVMENAKRVAVGTIPRLDEQQAESQAAASRANLLRAQIAEDTQQRVLKSLLSDNYSMQQNILIEVENDVAVARSTFQSVEATREARIFAQTTLDAEQEKLQSGRSTTFEVLTHQSQLTAARSAEISALVAYQTALARLSQAEGATLKRRHITLELSQQSNGQPTETQHYE